MLKLIWPEPDQIFQQSTLEQIKSGTLKFPEQTTNLLIVLINNKTDISERTSPKKKDTRDIKLILLQLSKEQAINITLIPEEMPIQLPGKVATISLGEIYHKGGLALSSDVINQILNIENFI